VRVCVRACVCVCVCVCVCDGLSGNRFVKRKKKEESKELLRTVERDQHYRISAIGVRSEFCDGCADPMCLH